MESKNNVLSIVTIIMLCLCSTLIVTSFLNRSLIGKTNSPAKVPMMGTAILSLHDTTFRKETQLEYPQAHSPRENLLF
jgi:hypothetical protein